jgi:hypothetical protein
MLLDLFKSHKEVRFLDEDITTVYIFNPFTVFGQNSSNKFTDFERKFIGLWHGSGG